MNFFKDFTIYAPVVAGSNFKVTLEKAVARPNPNYNEKDPHSSQGFIDFYWTRVSDGCPIRDSRMYPVGVRVLTEQLQDQGYVVDEKDRSLGHMVSQLTQAKFQYTCWCTESTVDDRHYKNFSFAAPAKANILVPKNEAPVEGTVAGASLPQF